MELLYTECQFACDSLRHYHKSTRVFKSIMRPSFVLKTLAQNVNEICNLKAELNR